MAYNPFAYNPFSALNPYDQQDQDQNPFQPSTNPFTKLLTGMQGMQNPMQNPAPQMQNPGQSMQGMQNPNQSMQGNDSYQYYQPRYDMENRFSSLLDNYPQPNKVGFWRGLGSALAGMGSSDPFKTAQEAAYAPYFNELQQYNNRARLMQQSADNERQMNQVGLKGNADVKKEEDDKAKEDLAKEKNQISMIRANAYALKNNGMTIKAPAGGYYTAIDAQGNAHYILDQQGNPVKTGTLSKEDEMALAGEQKMQQIGAQQTGAMDRVIQSGKNASNIEGLRNTDVLGQITARANEARTTKQTIPGKAAGNTMGAGILPSQQMNALRIRKEEILSAHPEWADYIQDDPVTKIPRVVLPAGSSGFLGMGAKPGGDPVIAQQIAQELYGNTSVTPVGTASTFQGKPINPAAQGNAPQLTDAIKQAAAKIPDKPGYNVVTDGNGKFQYINSGQVKDYLAAMPGWVLVK